jgi:hypothetical protein
MRHFSGATLRLRTSQPEAKARRQSVCLVHSV